jgi:hypothetical protein
MGITLLHEDPSTHKPWTRTILAARALVVVAFVAEYLMLMQMVMLKLSVLLFRYCYSLRKDFQKGWTQRWQS